MSCRKRERCDDEAAAGRPESEDAYTRIMLPFQIAAADIDVTSFSFRIEKHDESSMRVLRISRELRRMKSHHMLPCGESGAIFVRFHPLMPYVMKIMITGPKGTPYEYGCFLFDVYFPPNFPYDPPLVRFLTTGRGTVRFNPNLYICGKVCLSLLNTWSGPQWNPGINISQLFISIMGSIMGVVAPIYNEPGIYPSSDATERLVAEMTSVNGGILELRAATLRWAVLDVLRAPPDPFTQVVMKHFVTVRENARATWVSWYEQSRDFVELFLRCEKSLASSMNYVREIENTQRCILELLVQVAISANVVD